MPPYSGRSSNLAGLLSPQIQKNTEVDISYRSLWGYFKTPLIWTNITAISLIHFISLYGFLTFPYLHKWKLFVWGALGLFIGGWGVTTGAHRLWTHRSYKARLPLRILLSIFYTTAGQYSLYYWVRDHRVHHKFGETDADPHNINRGFFFAHVGWFMMKRHPEVLKKGRQIDCSDILADPVAAFFIKFHYPLVLVFCFILPTMVPYFFWNETLYWCVLSTIARYVVTLNCSWSVNSFAHMYGNKPYNKNIKSTENPVVTFFSMGEGWHNYHHTFPWDYRAVELGNYRANGATLFIDLCAKLGLAYDLKTPSKELVQKTVSTF